MDNGRWRVVSVLETARIAGTLFSTARLCRNCLFPVPKDPDTGLRLSLISPRYPRSDTYHRVHPSQQCNSCGSEVAVLEPGVCSLRSEVNSPSVTGAAVNSKCSLRGWSCAGGSNGCNGAYSAADHSLVRRSAKVSWMQIGPLAGPAAFSR
jgi:hypothetical protein